MLLQLLSQRMDPSTSSSGSLLRNSRNHQGFVTCNPRIILRAADSSTWIRGPEGWQCHAHSETFLTDAKAS
jgi:hypothetical protein